MHISSSPVVGVPGETGLLSAGVSGQCRPPHCGPQVAAGVAASRFAPLRFLAASVPDPQQAQSVPGSAIENLRCLLSVKAETYYFVNNTRAQYKNVSTAMPPHWCFSFCFAVYVCADDATGTKSNQVLLNMSSANQHALL